MRPVRLFLAAMVVAVLAPACGDEPSMTTPTPTPPVQSPAAIVHVDITPREATIAALGQALQLSATGRRSDGTTGDVGADLLWSTADPGIATVSGRGLVTARGYGRTTVLARTGEQYWNPVRLHVAVPAELRVPLTGVVRNQHGVAVPGAAVGLVSGDIGHTGVTDGNGFFDLGPSYGAVRLVFGRFGHDTTRVSVPDVAAQPHVQVTMVEAPSPYVERRIEARLAGATDVHRIVTRAGATLDVLAETPTCGSPSEPVGVGLRLTSGGQVFFGEAYASCARRVTVVVPHGECLIEVIGTPSTRYTLTFREPR